jgi:hypothetical protein
VWSVLTGRELGQFRGHQGGIASLAFSPDGTRLISGSLDTTALAWDVSRLPSAEPAGDELDAATLKTLWADLGSAEAAKAFEATRRLGGHPRQAVGLVKDHLQPARPVEPQRLARLIADLDDNQFAVRQRAAAELEQHGDLAATALRQVLQREPSLELRQRVERLLQKLSGPGRNSEGMQGLRAVELLEIIGDAEARQVLEALAKGAPEAGLTREANAALERLAKRSRRAP